MRPTPLLRFLSALAVSFLFLAPAVRCEPVLIETRLLPSDPGDGDNTGISVNIDGNVALVGSVFHYGPGIDSGTAYVYRWNGSSWRFEQKLTPTDPEPEDRFGRSVSVSGDVALVGAYRSDDAGSESGSAYVFRFDGTQWVQQQKLTASDATAGDRFGAGVSLRNGLAVVGAYRAGPYEQGAAYVFRFDGARWNEEQKLTADVVTPYDYYGFCVSTDGTRILIGDECDDDRGTDSGSAFLYHFDSGRWALEAKLNSSDAAAEDYFGHYVSLDGDALIVGAYGNDDAGSQSGSAYVFRHSGSTWVQEQKLTASDAAAGDLFGWNVSIRGDLALVGAQWNIDGGTAPGASYLFQRSGTVWAEEAELRPADSVPGALFGYAGSVEAGHLLVGAPFDTVNGIGSGAAYAFDLYDPADAGSAGRVTAGSFLRASPNPASPPIRLSWTYAGGPDHAPVTIYDALGRLVRVLPASDTAGSVVWDGRDDRGYALPSGRYYARPPGMARLPATVIIICR